MRGIPKGLIDDPSQLMGGGQFLAVTKDGEQPFRHDPGTGLLPDEALGHPVSLQPLVQPVPPFLVLMGVADEGLVLELLWVHDSQ